MNFGGDPIKCGKPNDFCQKNKIFINASMFQFGSSLCFSKCQSFLLSTHVIKITFVTTHHYDRVIETVYYKTNLTVKVVSNF